MTFSTAASVIRGEITSPWRAELKTSAAVCAKYIRRGYRVYYHRDAHCQELVDLVCNPVIADAVPSARAPSDLVKDAMFSSPFSSR